ncbi:MAG: hypothetical protein AAF933_10995 [Pseudomonadota bacterium]
MTLDSERLYRNERRNSLAAFLRAIRFRKPKRNAVVVERDFAQLHPRAPQHHRTAEDWSCVRSAN